MSKRRRQVWFITTIAIFLTILAILVDAAYSISLGVTLIDIVAGIVFSAIIAVFYLRQNKVLERQADISSYQVGVMRGDHEPILGVEPNDFGISIAEPQPCESDETPPDTEGDKMAWGWFIISNLGNEIAEDIQLRILLRYDEPDDPLNVEYTGMAQSLNNVSMTSQTSGSNGAVLPSDSNDIFMRTDLSVKKIVDSNAHEVPLSEVVSKLVCEYEVLTDIGFVIEFKNTIGSQYSMQLDSAIRLRPSQFSSDIDFGNPDLGEDYRIEDLVEQVEWEPPEETSTGLTMDFETGTSS